MRRRRNAYGRESYIPVHVPHGSCGWCGANHRVWNVRVETDGGRTFNMRGGPYCSWSCAESWLGERIEK